LREKEKRCVLLSGLRKKGGRVLFVPGKRNITRHGRGGEGKGAIDSTAF